MKTLIVQDMQKRIFLIQEVKPVLAVSIHQNSYEDSGVKGPQVFYYRDSVKGEELAEIIQEKLNDYLEVERPRQAKGNTTYYLLKRSPGILNIGVWIPYEPGRSRETVTG